jgi:hypothetical protein
MSNSSSSESLVKKKTLEKLVAGIVAIEADMKISPTIYKLADADSNDMLGWGAPPEIQELPIPPLLRVGTVGDGNCMLHSLLFATSPTYRSHDADSRSVIADRFREILIAREEELKDLADVFFVEIGGAGALAESFDILHEGREEVNLELGLLIARLYGYNFLAVQVRDDMSLRPVRMTLTNRDETLPTILVNYIGGGLDFGQADFQADGHYEAIVAGTLAEIAAAKSSSSSSEKKGTSQRKTKKKSKSKKAKKPVHLRSIEDNDAAEYVFQPGSDTLATVMALFAVSSGKRTSTGGARQRRTKKMRRYQK